MADTNNQTPINNAQNCEFTQAVVFIILRVLSKFTFRATPPQLETAHQWYPEVFAAINDANLPNNLSFTDALKRAGVVFSPAADSETEEQTNA